MLLLAGCQRPAAPAPSPLPFATGAYPSYGRAPDLSWFAGRIAKTIDGCVYVVFGSGRTQWGGRIAVTANPQTLARFPSGDMVVAFGSVSPTPRGGCGSATLAVSRIQEH